MSSPGPSTTTKTETRSVSISGVPVVNQNAMVNGNTARDTKVTGGAKTTTTTRTHSDGHRIKTETFSYTKGPTTTTRVTTAKQSSTKTAA